MTSRTSSTVENFNSLLNLANTLPDGMRRLTLELLEENSEAFMSVPAMLKGYYSYEGSNCDLTLETVCSALSEVRTRVEISSVSLSASLVCAGAILHGIGKGKCYEMFNESARVTKIGKFKSPAVVGCQMISDKAKELKIDVTQDWFIKLEHLITAPIYIENVSSNKFLLPEAFIIYQANSNSRILRRLYNRYSAMLPKSVDSSEEIQED